MAKLAKKKQAVIQRKPNAIGLRGLPRESSAYVPFRALVLPRSGLVVAVVVVVATGLCVSICRAGAKNLHFIFGNLQDGLGGSPNVDGDHRQLLDGGYRDFAHEVAICGGARVDVGARFCAVLRKSTLPTKVANLDGPTVR